MSKNLSSERRTPDERWARLARAIAHELRTPLHAMTGWLHVLEARLDAADPTQTKALAGLHRAIEQQIGLADQMSASAHGDSAQDGEQPLARIALWHQVRAAQGDQGPDAGAAGEPDCGLDEPIPGDRPALARAYAVLLDGLAAAPGTAAPIRVRFEAGRDSRLILCIEASTGQDPLALEDGERELPPKTVIERFRARQTLERHRITPLVRAARASGNDARAQADRPCAGAASTGRRVLVVDDQPELREVLSALIEQRGDRVVSASSAADAMNRLEGPEPFDIAILDIAMPGEDGISLIGRIRAREAGGHLPTIALTAHANARLRREALGAGFDVFLAKPVDPVELFETIDRLAIGRDTTP